MSNYFVESRWPLALGAIALLLFLAVSGSDGGESDGSADKALRGALQQASTADPAAQSQTVARCDGETTGVCFSRR